MLHKKSADFIPLSPADISAIRLDLALSPAEAGRIFGGGPKAFHKYENGSIKPSQALCRLLLVAHMRPSILELLRGRLALDHAGIERRSSNAEKDQAFFARSANRLLSRRSRP